MHESCCRYSDLELSQCRLVVTSSQNYTSLFKLNIVQAAKTLLSTPCVAGFPKDVCHYSRRGRSARQSHRSETSHRCNSLLQLDAKLSGFRVYCLRCCCDSWSLTRGVLRSWKHVALVHFSVCLQVPKVSLMTGEGLSWTVWIRLSLRTRESCSDKCPVLEMMTRRDSTERWMETSGTILSY